MLLLLVMVTGILRADDTPLERLSRRSALTRWQEIKEKWIPEKKSRKDRREERKAAPVPEPGQHSLPQELEDTETEESGETGIMVPQSQVPVHSPVYVAEPPALTQFPETVAPIPQAARATQPDEFEQPTPLIETLVPDPYEMKFPVADAPTTSSTGPILVDVPTPESAISVAQVGDPKDVTSLKLPLKSITEIQPFASYSAVEKQKDQDGNEITFVEDLSGLKLLDLPESGSLERNYGETHYHWMASNLHHNPLYFEDVSLERYGHTYPYGLQPFVSLSKFSCQVVGLPYQMALNPAWCDEYALGYYRPGDCAPKLRYRIPWDKKAVCTAAGVYTGLVFLFP